MTKIISMGFAAAALALTPAAFAQDDTQEIAANSAATTADYSDYFQPEAPDVPMTYDRGDVIPVEFGERDWQEYYTYGLPAAPSGFYWVRIDDDAYLVVPETGRVDLVIRNIDHSAAVS
ncbi:RcnB family protein [Ponticaulis sp.]|uniref:RcnB family protein n=1 Tax=Ponticaulis sp. TaxID=2020902 RepID=UPI000B648361|nr:RcnB family protein [Ponticaulis sp.]MAI90073.1 hypothetical protein [Ponticaulis sp.]OUX99729.1 MAG: hypothetical protein CBB65_06505 [Hyphomonadaceae bacterium TMED5]|tara:strand:- start:31462 stop:31818 length:357 start_codon:yes stop_codon:yes gene_type:complete